jgi:hypothetical protein
MRVTAGWFVFVCVALLSCTHQLDVRFEADTGCDNVTSRKRLGAGLVEVRGCGYRVRYVCAGGLCVREREERRATSAPPRRARAGSRSSTNRSAERADGVQVGRDGDGHRAVRFALRYGDAQLVFLGVPAEDRDHLRVQARDGSDRPLAGCASYQLHGRGHTVAVSATSGRLPVDELRSVASTLFGVDLCGRQLRVFERGQQQLAELLESFDSIAASAPAASPPPAEGGEPEPTIRARLDDRKAALLACLGGEPGAVTVRWTAAGELTVRVMGQDEGSPVHGCVRSALGQLTLVATEAGELLHAIAP